MAIPIIQLSIRELTEDLEYYCKDYLEEFDNRLDLYFIIPHILDECISDLSQVSNTIKVGCSAAKDILMEYELPDFVIDKIVHDLMETITATIKHLMYPIPYGKELTYRVFKHTAIITVKPKMRLAAARDEWGDTDIQESELGNVGYGDFYPERLRRAL